MKNQEIAKIFFSIASLIETNKTDFRSVAYKRAGVTLENLQEDVGQIYLEKGLTGLEEIPTIGKGLALKIEEYIKTGKVKEYDKLKKKLPIDLDEITKVEGMGVKKAKTLFQKLKIKNLKDLEKSAKAHKIAPLFGFGEKTEKNILQGIEFLKINKGRVLLGLILPTVKKIISELEKLPETKKISVAGSTRRRKETIGDVDILIASDEPEKIMDYFVKMDGVKKIWAKGETKSSVHLEEGFDVDLRIVKDESFGSALQYFTGSKEHNIATRKIAIGKGLKLSEYGVFRGEEQIAGSTEEDVYRAIGLQWMPPEIREDEGEVEAAIKGNIPHLVELRDIKGDLHCHSKPDEAKHSKNLENFIEEMVQRAMELGYEYLGISDHTKFLKIDSGLDEKQLLKQHEVIKKINEKYNGKIKILHGCEANIMTDGSIDIKDEVLAKLDYVIAGIHSSFKMTRKDMTQRLIKAMENPNVDIISHPTGRLIGRREEYQLDLEKIFEVARKTGTILEINSSPYRLDLRDIYIRRAKNEGVKMIINTDSHQKEQMSLMEFGVSMARRGWLEKSDIINTLSVEDLLKSLK